MTFGVIKIDIDLDQYIIEVYEHTDRFLCIMISSLLHTFKTLCSVDSDIQKGYTKLLFNNENEFLNCVKILVETTDEIPDKFDVSINHKGEQTNE